MTTAGVALKKSELPEGVYYEPALQSNVVLYTTLQMESSQYSRMLSRIEALNSEGRKDNFKRFALAWDGKTTLSFVGLPPTGYEGNLTPSDQNYAAQMNCLTRRAGSQGARLAKQALEKQLKSSSSMGYTPEPKPRTGWTSGR